MPAFSAAKPVKAPQLREWAADPGVRLSLRVESDGDGHERFRAVVQLHSLSDPTLVVDAADLWEGRDPGLGARAKVEALVELRRAVRRWPPLERLLDAEVPDELELTDEEVSALLSGAAAGIDVHWPRELVRGVSARAMIDGESSGLFSFNWHLSLGDDPLTAAEMDRLAEAHRPVVRLRDQWVLIDPAMARKAANREMKPLTGIEAIGAALTGTALVEEEEIEVSPAPSSTSCAAGCWPNRWSSRPPWPPRCATTSWRGCAGWPR
ncbi:SNF2 helicase-associated domain-containing protein [Nonomuraea recticatena]|uniref:SNF2 helicase-associated domain-containing protein n=1 Tax=Nonomuraea recticatena TaxID=46178 RepID=UPI0036212534